MRRLPSPFALAALAALMPLTFQPAARAQAATLPTSDVPLAATRGLDLAAMDPSVNPSRDFFRYANGGWLAHAVIPADHAESGAYLEVEERNLALLRAVAAEAGRDTSADPDTPEGKVGAFYRSATDEARIEADGVKPLALEFARIDGIKDVAGLEAEIGRLHREGVGAGWNFGVGQDDKDASQEIAQMGQGGLDLPERGYYTRTDKETRETRAAFVAHVARMMTLLGEPPTQAAADAGTVMALETRLAQASKTPEEQRDPVANYHKMTLAQLDALTPGVSWQPYFTALGLRDPGGMDVAQPRFFAEAGRMLLAVPPADWKTYLRWELLSAEASRLPRAFDQEHFRFFGTALNGVPAQQPRWKRALRATDGALGEAVGRLYVARAFSPEAKARVTALVQNLKDALGARITGLDWMSAGTKAQALTKLDRMAVKVGYPDRWRDYAGLDVGSPSYVVNGMRADEWEFQRDLNKIGKPVDRGEWYMTADTVDAYYSANTNDINFPAGILQPPLFSPAYDDAVNYGNTGATIGHEMTHGFDDQGRQYDAVGNLHDWWTPSDAGRYKARALGIVTQYSAYEPLPGLHINGALTQGENIADIGGLEIAYQAFEKAMVGKPRPKTDGFTPEQRFFLAYAQSWRTKDRPERERVSLLSDPHSPAEYRCNAVLADTPEFRQAFPGPPDPQASPTVIW